MAPGSLFTRIINWNDFTREKVSFVNSKRNLVHKVYRRTDKNILSMLCLLSLGPGLLYKKKVDWLPLDKLFCLRRHFSIEHS